MVRFRTLRLALLWAAAAATGARAQGIPENLPTGDRWIQHLQEDLLPWWTAGEALGNPLGAFPTLRCDTGSLVNFRQPCAEVRNNSWLANDNRYLVPLSRQTYGYGVAFHLTGDPKYLAYMKAGIDYIRRNAIDRQNGGMYTTLDATTGQWGPPATLRNAQELGYGLLGLSFYYYLTRDEEVLPDILAIKNYIFDHYYNPELAAMQWQIESGNGAQFNEMHLVSQLDQMNTYLVLMAPILPRPYRDYWKDTAAQVSRIMVAKFYSPATKLLFLAANTPDDLDLSKSGTDFGHNSKGMWMIRFTGLMTGQPDLVAFAEDNANGIFARAWMDSCNCWAEGLNPGGSLDINKSWWIYDELDQLAATLALRDPSYARYLPGAWDYWFNYFVDHQYHEVWNGVDGTTNQAIRDLPKQWQWKSAYHDFEHVLVSYIAAQQLHGLPVKLYYAFTNGLPGCESGIDGCQDTSLLRPYYFEGAVSGVETVDGDNPIQAITYTGVH